jgi:hypothetical protein
VQEAKAYNGLWNQLKKICFFRSPVIMLSIPESKVKGKVIPVQAVEALRVARG